jgi:hypothetical protein
MIIGFSKHGTGGGGRPIAYLTAERVAAKPIDYLTGKAGKDGVRRDPAPFVVRGDPARTKALIDSLSFKHKYTSGVCSFSKGEIVTPEMESSIIDQFERTAFAGLDPSDYDILWVRHTHTSGGRHELHFLTPRVHLRTGKSLNIAPPRKSTREVFDMLRESINRQFNLASPDDPARARAPRLPACRANLKPHLEPNVDLAKTRQLTPGSPGLSGKTPEELDFRIQELIQKRTDYNQQRYPQQISEPKGQRNSRPLFPTSYDRAGISTIGSIETPGIPLCGTGEGTPGHARRLNESTKEWSQANERLERAVGRFEPTVREIEIAADQDVEVGGGLHVVGAIFLKFAIPIRARSNSNEISDHPSEIEEDMEMPL